MIIFGFLDLKIIRNCFLLEEDNDKHKKKISLCYMKKESSFQEAMTTQRILNVFFTFLNPKEGSET